MSEQLKAIETVVDEFAPFVEAHINMPYRAQTVSYRILELYLKYCKELAEALILKTSGMEYAAKDRYNEFRTEIGKQELAFERYYDQTMCMASLQRIFNTFSGNAKDAEEVVYQQ